MIWIFQILRRLFSACDLFLYEFLQVKHRVFDADCGYESTHEWQDSCSDEYDNLKQLKHNQGYHMKHIPIPRILFVWLYHSTLGH